jgi:hypothetical protein
MQIMLIRNCFACYTRKSEWFFIFFLLNSKTFFSLSNGQNRIDNNIMKWSIYSFLLASYISFPNFLPSVFFVLSFRRAIRYEDLSLNPYDMSQDLLQFYGFTFDDNVQNFLDSHTKVNIGGVSSTFRDSKSAPFHWTKDLRFEEVSFSFISFVFVIYYDHHGGCCVILYIKLN